MGNYGSDFYGSGVYGGGNIPTSPTSIPVIIELYDNNKGYKNTYQTGVGGFVGVNFRLDESGPADFIIVFTGPQRILTRDIIKIRLFNSADY